MLNSTWHSIGLDDDVGAGLKAQPLELEGKALSSEQWNNFEYAEAVDGGFDGFNAVWNELAQPIGIVLVVFSELEASLERFCHEGISDRSEHLGMIVTRNMDYMQKVKLLIDLLRTLPEKKEKAAENISRLKKHLVRAGEIRNIVAHARWPSLEENGFVFSTIASPRDSYGSLELKYYKLDKVFLQEADYYISAVNNMLYYVTEDMEI